MFFHASNIVFRKCGLPALHLRFCAFDLCCALVSRLRLDLPMSKGLACSGQGFGKELLDWQFQLNKSNESWLCCACAAMLQPGQQVGQLTKCMPALQGYPSQGQLPVFQLLGPALAPEQNRCLYDHLEDVARENVEHMNMGCVYQVIEAQQHGVHAEHGSECIAWRACMESMHVSADMEVYEYGLHIPVACVHTVPPWRSALAPASSAPWTFFVCAAWLFCPLAQSSYSLAGIKAQGHIL